MVEQVEKKCKELVLEQIIIVKVIKNKIIKIILMIKLI